MRNQNFHPGRPMAAAALALCLALPLSGCNWEEWFKQNGGTYPPPVSSSSSVSDDDDSDGGGGSSSGSASSTPADPLAPENWPVDENGKLTIPNGVTSVSLNDIQTAAAGKNVTAVELPGSVTSVDLSGAGLKQIVDSGITVTGGNIKFVNLSGCRGVTANNLTALIPKPSSVESIDLSGANMNKVGDALFKSFSGLKSVDLSGSSIQSIGDNAIKNCPRLETIDLSNCTSLTSIGKAFRQSTAGVKTNVKTVNLSGCDQLTSFGANAFNGCPSMETIVLPEKLTSIGSSCFAGCTSLKEVTLPEGVTDIGEMAFYNCTNLRTIDLSNITVIKDTTFQDCSNLTNVTFSKDLTTIGMNAFEGTNLNTLDLSGCTALTLIGQEAFWKCSQLATIKLPDPSSKLTFGSTAFGSISGHVDIYIPSSAASSDYEMANSNNSFSRNAILTLHYGGSDGENLKTLFEKNNCTVNFASGS